MGKRPQKWSAWLERQIHPSLLADPQVAFRARWFTGTAFIGLVVLAILTVMEWFLHNDAAILISDVVVTLSFGVSFALVKRMKSLVLPTVIIFTGALATNFFWSFQHGYFYATSFQWTPLLVCGVVFWVGWKTGFFMMLGLGAANFVVFSLYKAGVLTDFVPSPLEDHAVQFLIDQSTVLPFALAVAMMWETSRRKAEAQVRAAERSAAVAEQYQMIGRLAGEVAHEVNNPLAIVSMHTRRLGLGSDQTEYSVEVIQRSVARIGNIVESLLTLAPRDTDRGQKARLDHVFDEIKGRSQRFLAGRGVRLEIGEAGASEVVGSREEIEKVLFVLLSHAADLGVRGEAEQTIAMSVEEDESMARIKIQFDADELPETQTVYFDSRSDGPAVAGYALAKTMIESKGGSFEMKTNRAQREFEVRWPRAQVEAA
jgi:signal transduction histidine kinase